MTTATRRHIHAGLAVFFLIQVPVAIWLQYAYPEVFEKFWKTYLIFLSLYAIVSTHWAGASAETPNEEGDE